MCPAARAGHGVRVLAGEASAHKRLPFIAFEFLCAGFFVTYFHLVLLTLSCSLHSFFRLRGEACFHKCLPFIPFPFTQSFGIGVCVAGLHLVLLSRCRDGKWRDTEAEYKEGSVTMPAVCVICISFGESEGYRNRTSIANPFMCISGIFAILSSRNLRHR